jgi:hypothetical protein
MKHPSAITKKAAESLAIQALAFIASDEDRIGPFLAITGIGPDDIRAAAGQRDFLAGVLDYMAGDEALLVAFATQAGFNPFDIEVAREVLSGRRSRP